MNKKEKVISLELAKELQKVAKENGFKLPESECVWFYKPKIGWELRRGSNWALEIGEAKVSAFDTSELGEMLPGNIDGYVFQTQKGMLGRVYYCTMTKNNERKYTEQSKTEAEARGKMLIHLISNKLL